MYTMAFVGPSGTGKSHRSVTIAQQMGADAIIDDGLLISKNKVLAGFSAKKEATRIAAVKRALFTKQEHIWSVKKAIKENKLERILILGTSLAMAERIANQLEIAPIQEIVKIEDVATEEEMKSAIRMRTKEGKHVIPVPVFELKQDFSGYFLHPLRQIKNSWGKPSPSIEDKSIVRPTFSYMGEYAISNSVVSSIASYEAMKIEGVEKVNSVIVDTVANGAEIDISLTLKYGYKMQEIASAVQKLIIKSIDYHTSVNVKRVNVYIKKLV